MDGDDANRPNINDIRALDTLTNFLRVPHETASDIVDMFSYMTVGKYLPPFCFPAHVLEACLQKFVVVLKDWMNPS